MTKIFGNKIIIGNSSKAGNTWPQSAYTKKGKKNCHKRQTIFFRIVFFHVISALLVYVFFLGYE